MILIKVRIKQSCVLFRDLFWHRTDAALLTDQSTERLNDVGRNQQDTEQPCTSCPVCEHNLDVFLIYPDDIPLRVKGDRRELPAETPWGLEFVLTGRKTNAAWMFQGDEEAQLLDPVLSKFITKKWCDVPSAAKVALSSWTCLGGFRLVCRVHFVFLTSSLLVFIVVSVEKDQRVHWWRETVHNRRWYQTQRWCL